MSTTTDQVAAVKRTPLHSRHLALGARMAPFGGFDMPIQYTGIMQEHAACRQGASIFDTCHMGEFHMEGPRALADLERLVSCDVATMAIGQCRYGLLCNDQGGVRDDLLVYRQRADAFMIVVNAGTQDADFAWFAANASAGTRLENRSDATAKLDIQGPGSARLLTRLFGAPIADLPFYRFHENRYRNQPVLVSRTGYTGEIGFEVYCDNALVLAIWDDCVSGGAAPTGLGARDTLRLEMGMPLYGHELGEERHAAESGFAASISATKDFIGAGAVRNPARRRQALVGLTLEGRRAARAGDAVHLHGGARVGTVTSGSFAPSLGCAIALAYVDVAQSAEGQALHLQTARDALPARVTKTPFYRAATGRKPLAEFL